MEQVVSAGQAAEAVDQDFLVVMGHLPDAVVAIGADQRILFFNRAAEMVFQYPADEVIGRPLDMLLPPQLRHMHRCYVEAFLASPVQSRHMNERQIISGRRKDGHIFPAEAAIVKCQNGAPFAVCAILRDVTERHVREAKVQASEQKYRAIMEGCPDAILVASATTGRVLEVNEAAAQLFGCSSHELVGLHQSELHPPESRKTFVRTFREHIEAGRILVPDGEIQRADGVVVPVEIAARPVEIGGDMAIVGFFRDITHRKQREKQLEDALHAARAASTAKAMFLANMSHELRTPLNSIIGFSEILENEMYGNHADRRYREYSSYIRNSGSHLLELVNDVLNISAIELGKYKLNEEPLDITAVFSECRTMLKLALEAAGVSLGASIDSELRLLADRRCVKQMAINLLSNAVKNTSAGGRIVFSSERSKEGELALCVADTGRGIDQRRLKEIVEPFGVTDNIYTRTRGGVGLGLSITRALIEMHDGRLELESRAGQGFTARLIFPACRVCNAA